MTYAKELIKSPKEICQSKFPDQQIRLDVYLMIQKNNIVSLINFFSFEKAGL